MHAVTAGREGQKGALMQQGFKVEVGPFADQLKVKAKGLADRLLPRKTQDLEIRRDPI
jgi:hypothetical protein